MPALAVERRPAIGAPGRRIALLHGFTQTRRSWSPVIARLGDGYEAITVDAPGHGESHDVHLDMPATADLLAEAIGPATYVGYSMGGRLALHVAAAHPAVVERLVLVSASPGVADEHERAARRAADDQLAGEIEREGVESFLDRWIELPLFARLPRDAAGLDERRANTATGLASSLRLSGAGSQEPLWERLATLTMPTLLVVGEHDTKFRDLAVRMAASLPNASLEVVVGAGHVVHLERPDAFVAALRGWLDG